MYTLIIWRHFTWSNQTLATIVLWAITVYLSQEWRFYWITLLPAVFMTAVTTTYLLFAPEGFSLSKVISYFLGVLITILSLLVFFRYRKKFFKRAIIPNK